MMKPPSCIERRVPLRRRPRGDALLEALVGIAVAAVLGLGLSYAAGRMLHSQRYASTQGAAVNQMRAALAEQGLPGLCDGTQTARLTVAPAGSPGTTVALAPPPCTRDAVTVGVAGSHALDVTSTGVVTRMQLSTPRTEAAQALLGPGTLAVSQ